MSTTTSGNMSSGSDVSFDSDSEEETLITVSPGSNSHQHGEIKSQNSHGTDGQLNSHDVGNSFLNPSAPSYPTAFNQTYKTGEFCAMTGARRNEDQLSPPTGTSTSHGRGRQSAIQHEDFGFEDVTDASAQSHLKSGARPKRIYVVNNHREGSSVLPMTQSGNNGHHLHSSQQDVQRSYHNRGQESLAVRNSCHRQQANNSFAMPQFVNSGRDYMSNTNSSKNLGLKKLEEWSKAQNDILLVFEMNSCSESLVALLSQNRLRSDMIHLLILILKKILYAQSQKTSLKTVLECVCKSSYFDTQLPNFFDEMEKGKIYPDVYGCVQKTVDVLEYVIINLGLYNVKCNQCLTVLAEKWARLNVLKEGSSLTLRITKLLEISRSSQVPYLQSPVSHPRPRKPRYSKAVPVPDDEEPPDDYSLMKIFPDTTELETFVEPFLRANKTTGPYRDLQHYLDVQTRLFREDYLAPIRSGLQEYKTALRQCNPVKEDNLRFYYKVSLATMKCDTDSGILHFVTFDTSTLGSIEWEFSKRLKFGSLLVLSKDDFVTTIFATVANRDVPKLERGVVQVEFQNNLEEVFTSAEKDTFVMAETTAYFESYRHVLEGLLEMQSIPLERYIVSCMRDVKPPQYLLKDPFYNIDSIMKTSFDNNIVPVLDQTLWPDSENTSLNESQLEALKLALGNEMAIIQGPPGTGKTYVGLKIMKILLENRVMQQSKGVGTPILVVCFTNHALDQFLEGMLAFCDTGIVRVGGRSSSEQLQAFNLKELRKNRRLAHRTHKKIAFNLRQSKHALKEVSKYVESYWQESLRLETTILSDGDLSEEMHETHKKSLTDPRRCTGISTHIMSTWLKASNANMERHLGEASKRHLAKVIARGGETVPDMNLKCKEDARRCDFQKRVKIYNFWLMKFNEEIEREIALLLSDDIDKNQERVNRLLSDMEATGSDILSDQVLKPYMNEKAYSSVKECVDLENKTMEHDNDYIRQWLLSICCTTDMTLDAIEQLTKVKDDKRNFHGRKPVVDNEVKVHEDRWVIDDSDSDDSDMDFCGSDDENDRERNDMEDLDDGGMVQMSDVTELEESFKQFSLKEINMLQRAKMLGVDLSETSPENHWKTVSNMSYGKVFQLYHSVEAFTDEEAEQIEDVWSLQIRDRYRLYKYWVQSKKYKLTSKLILLTREYKIILQRKKEAQSLRDIEILKRARVIGMTTTGAAIHRSVLKAVGCRIIVVEEAAEVLEAHIVTTLNQNCQHLILIGDHQQLRPSPTVHKLAVDYELEISLFERLVKNNVPHVMLNEQHRMRPEISEYVKHIYPHLEDHETVYQYDNIRGIQTNVFFLQHSYEESAVEDSTSKSNQHEAKFLVKLCKYFIQQGYMGKKITILAAYGGQVKAIRQEMEMEEDAYENVRVTSIDNYQGEENDIILLSLVRSNAQNDVGFLKTDNRVCVALSRAKKGLFVIGNLQLLALKSRLWRRILDSASANDVTGVHLKLVCVNHSHHITPVQNPSDFQTEVPEGGCKKPCDYILPCGHQCTRMCHASDRLHQNSTCRQPCTKVCPFGHPCQKDCCEECGLCEVRVDKEISLCGHIDQVACYLDVDEVLCSQHCGLILTCKHKCHGQCGRCMRDGHQLCLEIVDKTWPCGHTNKIECHTDTSIHPCPESCKQRLECGHKCKGTCGSCLHGRVHEACGESCKKILPCGHPCKGPCGAQCVPCGCRCPTACRHRICDKNCGDICDPCMENCSMICKHKKCERLCMDECIDTSPCSKKCGLPVPKCNHKCSSLCGEPCICFNCEQTHFNAIDFSKTKKPQYVVAHEKRERAKKMDVGEDTLLMKIPKCGHIFTLKQLDRWVENFEPESTSFIRCPVCPASLHGISRYKTINKIREEKRENKKEDLIKSSQVPEYKISCLRESVDLIESFCIVDRADFLTTKRDQIDTNHAQALTMQIRFAFVLSEIYKIHRTFNEDTEFNISKWKRIVTSVNKVMTPQMLRELTMELHRLLILEQVSILSKYAKDTNMKVSDDLKSAYRAILKVGKTEKLTPEHKRSYQGTVRSLYKIFDGLDESFEYWCTKAEKLKEKSDRVSKYLDSPAAEDLSQILHSI